MSFLPAPNDKLPEFPEARTVPAHVTSRSNRPRRALPPPVSNSINKATGKPNGNRDSSLEDDGTKYDETVYCRAQTGSSIAKSERYFLNPILRGGTRTTFRLGSEEAARMTFRRELEDTQAMWDKSRRQREECEARRQDREERLASIAQRCCSAANVGDQEQGTSHKMFIANNRMRNYVDDVMLETVKKKVGYLEATMTEQEEAHYLQEVITEAEFQVLHNWAGHLHRGLMIYETSHPIEEYAVKLMRRYLWQKFVVTELISESHLLSKVKQYLESFRSSAVGSHQSETSIQEILGHQLEDRLITEIVDAMCRDLILGVQRVPEPQVYTEPLKHIFQVSRTEEGHLAPDYVSWVASIFNKDTLDLRIYCMHRSEVVRRALRLVYPVDDARDITHSGIIGHAFVEENPHNVFLIIFRGDRPFSRHRVSPEDLLKMGWYRQARPAHESTDGVGLPYWRYSNGIFQPGRVFKVQMNGEVTGIMVPGLTEGLDWKDVMKEENSDAII